MQKRERPFLKGISKQQRKEQIMSHQGQAWMVVLWTKGKNPIMGASQNRGLLLYFAKSLENLVPPGMYIDYLPQLVNPIVSISNLNELVHQSWSVVICKPVDLEEVFPRYPKNIAEEDVVFSHFGSYFEEVSRA